MEEERKKRLTEAGIHVDSGIARFMGNEGLFLKFLGKFLQDTNYEGLVQAVDRGDIREAFRFSHTLKGVCGNLSMEELYGLVSRQTEFFREGDFRQGADMMEEISRAMEKIRKGIGDNRQAL